MKISINKPSIAILLVSWFSFLSIPGRVLAQETSPVQRVARVKLTPEVQEAISKGLVFLSKTQKQDGSWGDKHPVADTSLALMSFMLQGHVPGKGSYGDHMERGLAYIVNIGNKDMMDL